MAGSLDHCLDGWSLIENMGDSFEATEQMLWLVLSEIGEDRARNLIKERFYKMKRGERGPDEAYKKTMRVMRQ